MAKKLAKVKARIAPTNELELRRWCIEQANAWRWDPGSEYRNLGGQFPTPGRPPSQPDILKRAAEILQWVKGAA